MYTNPLTSGSGVAVMRAAVIARNKKVNLTGMAQTVGISGDDLERWSTNPDTVLPDEVMQKLADYLFGYFGYDSVSDRLVSKPPPAPVQPTITWPPKQTLAKET